jgi:hypothetical protein
MRERQGRGVPGRLLVRPLSDTGVYRSTCPVGHATVTILQQMRFEVLAEAALQAILDG